MMKAHLDESMMTEQEIRRYRWKIRRRRELRNRWMLLVFTICLIIGFAITFNAIISRAETDANQKNCKYYSSIMVKYGDSLWSIASQYMDSNYKNTDDYIEEVIHINHLDGDKVKAGQHLIIPYYLD